MKDLLLNKTILLFVAIVLGVVLLGGETNKLEESKQNEYFYNHIN